MALAVQPVRLVRASTLLLLSLAAAALAVAAPAQSHPPAQAVLLPRTATYSSISPLQDAYNQAHHTTASTITPDGANPLIARYGQSTYALASVRGAEGQPELFIQVAGGAFKDTGASNSKFCTLLPQPVLNVFGFWRLCPKGPPPPSDPAPGWVPVPRCTDRSSCAQEIKQQPNALCTANPLDRRADCDFAACSRAIVLDTYWTAIANAGLKLALTVPSDPTSRALGGLMGTAGMTGAQIAAANSGFVCGGFSTWLIDHIAVQAQLTITVSLPSLLPGAAFSSALMAMLEALSSANGSKTLSADVILENNSHVTLTGSFSGSSVDFTVSPPHLS